MASSEEAEARDRVRQFAAATRQRAALRAQRGSQLNAALAPPRAVAAYKALSTVATAPAYSLGGSSRLMPSTSAFTAASSVAARDALHAALIASSDEAVQEVGREAVASALEAEAAALRAQPWRFTVPRGVAVPLTAGGATQAEQAARVAARARLVALLGPALGFTPESAGNSHVPAPLRQRREERAAAALMPGPADHVTPSSAAGLTRHSSKWSGGTNRQASLHWGAVGRGAAPVHASPVVAPQPSAAPPPAAAAPARPPAPLSTTARDDGEAKDGGETVASEDDEYQQDGFELDDGASQGSAPGRLQGGEGGDAEEEGWEGVEVCTDWDAKRPEAGDGAMPASCALSAAPAPARCSSAPPAGSRKPLGSGPKPPSSLPHALRAWAAAEAKRLRECARVLFYGDLAVALPREGAPKRKRPAPPALASPKGAADLGPAYPADAVRSVRPPSARLASGKYATLTAAQFYKLCLVRARERRQMSRVASAGPVLRENAALSSTKMPFPGLPFGPPAGKRSALDVAVRRAAVRRKLHAAATRLRAAQAAVQASKRGGEQGGRGRSRTPQDLSYSLMDRRGLGRGTPSFHASAQTAALAERALRSIGPGPASYAPERTTYASNAHAAPVAQWGKGTGREEARAGGQFRSTPRPPLTALEVRVFGAASGGVDIGAAGEERARSASRSRLVAAMEGRLRRLEGRGAAQEGEGEGEVAAPRWKQALERFTDPNWLVAVAAVGRTPTTFSADTGSADTAVSL